MIIIIFFICNKQLFYLVYESSESYVNIDIGSWQEIW